MQIIFLVIIGYLFMPVIGILFLLISGENVVAGKVDFYLFFHNLIHSIIVISIILFFYFKNRKNEINFYPNTKDLRSLKRIAVLSTIFCLIVFYIAGYGYLFKGAYRGDIRVSLGYLGFLYRWITIYAMPVLMLLTTIIILRNKKINKFLFIYIYIIGVMSAFFTGYKYVVVYTFIPVFLLFFYKKNIFKVVLCIVPIVLGVLTFTTKQVMNFDNYSQSFYFVLHRMTVMSAFGTIGVWDLFKDGVGFNQSAKLLYGLFGNKMTELFFDIDFNSVEALDANLSRKITYLVYPSWEKALSGTTNVTVTNFGEAVYIFGKNYWVYSVLAGILISFFVKKLDFYIYKGDVFRVSLFYIFTAAVLFNWLNSSSFLTLISIPVLLYMLLTYMLLKFIFNTKIW